MTANLQRLRQAYLQKAYILSQAMEMLQAETQDENQNSEQTEGRIVSTRHFVISSLFLRHCFAHLTRTQDETVAYLSGILKKNIFFLDYLALFDVDVQEPTSARGNIISSTAKLEDLSDRGFELGGIIHPHPGSGESSTHPSGVDLTQHRNLEQGGYKAVGVIIARDGHVRFYSHEMPFTVEVIGKDVMRLSDRSFRIILEFHGDEDSRQEG